MTDAKPRKTGSKPVASITFDETDQRILELLQHDSDTPVQAISEAVGLSTNPCWRRIKRMEEAGLITRRVALVER